MSRSALVDRAITYLSERRCATPRELAAHVFGGESFAPLLASIEDARLLFDGETWTLAKPTDDWAILELLSSGPNPSRHRVVELAAVRQGRTYHAFIAGHKPVPRLLRRLGVPAQCDADSWRPLDEVAAELRTFLGGTTVVGFSYVPAFIEQLLGPAWPAIDLLQLLYKVSYYDGRPDPLRLARHFGLTAPLNRRPEPMSAFSTALFDRLRGQRSLAELRDLAAPQAAQRPRLPELPEQPGVYLMSSSNGEALYVGKSVNLRGRVSSYIGRPIAESRSLYQLAQLTQRVDVIPVHSELEALLLESRLIRAWQPAFNVQRQTSARCRYLRLSTHEAFPRLTLCAAPGDDEAAYFGPFRHATAALRLCRLVQDVVRLRSCTRRLPSHRKPRPACGKAAAGTCLAPCVIGPPVQPYSREVELARELLGATPERFRHLLLRLLRERPPQPAQARRLKQVLETLTMNSQSRGRASAG